MALFEIRMTCSVFVDVDIPPTIVEAARIAEEQARLAGFTDPAYIGSGWAADPKPAPTGGFVKLTTSRPTGTAKKWRKPVEARAREIYVGNKV